MNAVTSDKVSVIAARMVAGGSFTEAEARRVAASCLRQKEKRAAKRLKKAARLEIKP